MRQICRWCGRGGKFRHYDRDGVAMVYHVYEKGQSPEVRGCCGSYPVDPTATVPSTSGAFEATKTSMGDRTGD